MAYRICEKCTPKHYENCGTCFGFGVYTRDNRPGEVFPLPASRIYSKVGLLLQICPECGSDINGIPAEAGDGE
jgi:hypothetical protein